MFEKAPGVAICAIGLLAACGNSSDNAVIGTTLEAGVDAGLDAAVGDAVVDNEGSDAQPTDECGYLGGTDCDGVCGGAGFESPWCENGSIICPTIIEDPLDMPCYCFGEAWNLFLWQNQGCSTAEDCVLVDAPESCGCRPVIGSPSGTPLAEASLPDAADYLTRLHECANAQPTVYTSCGNAPAQNLRCENNTCVADVATCASDGDASTDAALD